MHEVIAWCGFVGAWFLVAGPIYQASIELEDEEFQRDTWEAAVGDERPAPVSAWWWLLPPVMYVLQVRRSREHKMRVLRSMSTQDVEAYVSFSAKAGGWFTVGAGGFLIAVKETYELLEAMEWPEGLIWVLVPVMALGSVVNTVARTRRNHAVLETRGTSEPGPA